MGRTYCVILGGSRRLDLGINSSPCLALGVFIQYVLANGKVFSQPETELPQILIL